MPDAGVWYGQSCHRVSPATYSGLRFPTLREISEIEISHAVGTVIRPDLTLITERNGGDPRHWR